MDVGPPGGPTLKIPSGFTIRATDVEPYDLELDVKWDPQHGRHTLRKLTIEARDDSDDVRMSKINQLKLREIVSTALVRENSSAMAGGNRSWPTIANHDQVAVDALVYLLSHALGSQKPSATVATAVALTRHRPQARLHCAPTRTSSTCRTRQGNRVAPTRPVSAWLDSKSDTGEGVAWRESWSLTGQAPPM